METGITTRACDARPSWSRLTMRSSARICRASSPPGTVRGCKGWRVVSVSLTISPIRNEVGEIVGVSTIARDLSAAQQAHRELQRREALLRSILDTVPDALVLIDQRGLIQSFSKVSERLFGYDTRSVIGSNVSILMPSPYSEQHDQYLSQYLATGERHIIGVGRVAVGRRQDDSTFPMELAVGEVNLPSRRLFTGFIRDLTERQDRDRWMAEVQSELIHV
jgi:two-component system, LuxR family, sensor kinase FixL